MSDLQEAAVTAVSGQNLWLCLLPWTQWAAVTTHLSLTRLPPQKGEKAGGLRRKCGGGRLSIILELSVSSSSRPVRLGGLLRTAWWGDSWAQWSPPHTILCGHINTNIKY